MVEPPERERVPHPKLLVEHLDDAIDDLVEKHWEQDYNIKIFREANLLFVEVYRKFYKNLFYNHNFLGIERYR